VNFFKASSIYSPLFFYLLNYVIINIIIFIYMIFYILSGFINAITSLVLGLIILTKRRDKININFSLFCFSVSFWSWGYFFWLISNDYNSALFWCKFLSVVSILIPIFYLQFTLEFLGLINKIFNKILLRLGYALTIFFVLLTPSKLLVEGVSEKMIFKYWPDAGLLYPSFLLLFFGLAAYSIIQYMIELKKSVSLKRAQIKYLLIGTSIGFLGGSTNFLLWYDIPIPPYGNILVSLYVFFTAYAIITHRLMGIKFVLRKSAVYITSILTISALAFLVQLSLTKLFGTFNIWANIFILIGAISLYPFIKDKYYKIANKYFFSSLYDSNEVISGLSDTLRSTLDSKKIYDSIYTIITNAFHTTKFGVLKYNISGDLIVEYNNGFDVEDRARFKGNEYLRKKYVKNNQLMVIEELKKNENSKNIADTMSLMKTLDAEVICPLLAKDNPIGLIVLGPKEAGDIYNDEDLRVLKIISAQAAMAIENALLYQETLTFNVTLKNEINKATQELQLANAKLRRLDEAKSEFISIASHQLRTPLTIVKGFVSMILEGSFGKIKDNQRDALEKVYESNERLITLVENLLSISRMESGRLKYDLKEFQLEYMIESVYDELKVYAQKKNLELRYIKPKNKLPMVNIDQEKIRQVVMNLTDNAIKYTQKGFVEISLRQTGDFVEYCVRDSGMGISADDLPHLFKKFVRGTGTSLVHTEGTGLGLYVAKQMVEAHNGVIWAESKGQDKGSIFCFKLPIIK